MEQSPEEWQPKWLYEELVSVQEENNGHLDTKQKESAK
jgi:hypothetical protein